MVTSKSIDKKLIQCGSIVAIMALCAPHAMEMHNARVMMRA